VRRAFTIACALASASTAFAEGVTLRMAAVAPDGTAYARELRAFARDVEQLSNGAVRVKWYLGAIAGDELTVLERVRRGQLEGQAGAQFCDRLAPSLKVTRVIGLFHNHDEALFLLGKMQPMFEREFQQHGFVDLGVGGGFGSTFFFTRDPARNLAELRRERLWIWDLDDVPKQQLTAMGMQAVPTPPESAARAYDDKKLDGFLSIPTGALAFQWSSQARYFTALEVGFLPACVSVSTTAFDALTIEQQQALRHAAAKLQARFEELGRTDDDKLLHGLFERQGLKRVEVSDGVRDEFYTAARSARDKIDDKLVSTELMQVVNRWLGEYRAAHH
jgi:TRAP-type transport system periplasmic protein